ncbi:MAG: efflux RND transporter permease subunit [Bacteroidia bacterium]
MPVRSIIQYFIKYPIWVNALILLVIALGVFSIFSIRKRYFPLTDPNTINISVVYPGASPEELEEGVVVRIEESLRGVDGIDQLTSSSGENLGTVTIEIKAGYDPDQVLTDVKNAVDQISSFPDGAENPVVFRVRPRSEGVEMILVGETDLMALKTYAEGIRDDLLASDIVSQVTLSGYPNREVSIEVREEVLRRYDLTFDRVAAAIRANNRDVSAGSIKSSTEEVLLRSRYRKTDPNGLGDIIIRTNADGSILRLRDVAEIKAQFAEVPNKSTFNGQNAVFLAIATLPEEDIVEVVDYVRTYAEAFNKENELVQIVLANDRSDYLKQRLTILLNNGFTGLVLVLILLGMFLNLRLSFWVAFGIPFSFMGMLFVAHMLGVTINMISLFGMILVVGILVDDGIIVGENIYTHFERGKSPLRASLDGTTEVILSVLTGVTTTMLAFSVFYFIEGRFGEIIKEMATVVILSLAFSLIECAFFLPPHLAHSRALHVKENTRFRRAMDWLLRALRDRLYAPVLAFSMRQRYVVVGTGAFLCMVAWGLFQGGYIKFGFFPFIDSDDINAELILKPGTREQITERYMQAIEADIWALNEDLKAKRPDGKSVIQSVRMDLGRAGTESGSHTGQLSITLLPGEERNMPSYELGNLITQQVGAIPEAEFFSVGARSRWGKPLSVSLKSKNAEEMEAAMRFLKGELNNYADLKEITDTNLPGSREVNITLRPQAYVLGLTQDEITRQIRQGFFGEEVQRLLVGTDEVRVWLRYPEQDRSSIGEMENIMIKTADQRELPLRDLIDYDIERGLVNIKHLDGAREIRVEADLVDKNQPIEPITARVRSEVIPRLRAQYPGVQVTLEGQQRRSDEIFGSLLYLFPIAIAGIFLIISLTFRSFSQALLILLMIPLGFAGAAFGHYLLGATMSIFSIYGMIALSGVIVNDAVVFTDTFNRLLKQGRSLAVATFFAGKSRFRPIILTSLTTVIGLYPLILAKSRQAQFLVPMAISVAYGVLLGTFFILTVFPALLMVANDIRVLIRWGWRWGWHDEPETPGRTRVEPAIIEEHELNKIQ